MSEKAERLQKIISDYGITSRRKAENLIAAGMVKVNGRVAKIGDKAVAGVDLITVGDIKLIRKTEPVYLMLNKPRGYITTLSDEFGRKNVTELVEDIGTRVFPVGRLDRNSEGLLLLTNDGEFANMMMHPSQGISKTYRVTVKANVEEDTLDKFRVGITVDGIKLLPADCSVVKKEKDRTVIEITIYEGKNRQIRRMFESEGFEVARLKRIEYGGLKLGYLQVGKWRLLSADEVEMLKNNAILIPEEEKKLAGNKKVKAAKPSGGKAGKKSRNTGRQN